jgi:hypothetical protein
MFVPPSAANPWSGEESTGISTLNSSFTQKDCYPQQSRRKVGCLAGGIWEELADQNPCSRNPDLVACDVSVTR